MKRQLLAGLGLLVLQACASGTGSAVIQPLPSQMVGQVRVSEVQLANAPATGVSADFEALFERIVGQKLAACAQGGQPLSLEIVVDNFDRANPALTWLLSDGNQISGIARLRDSSGNLVGEYLIKRAFVGSGLVGIAMMAQAEEQMSAAFGDEICKQAFTSAH